MAKVKFRENTLRKKSLEMLEQINWIIEEYSLQGYTLTLRQLYYQLVSRDIVPNKQKEYDKLGRLVKEGRMSGLIDWNAIEDRLRVPKLPYYCEDIEGAMNDIISQYRLNRQNGQNNYIEVWVEKDALSAVLYRVTQKYHINLMVNRGYSSASAMYDAYKRFCDAIENDQDVQILYLGDHDPSGLDMINDIRNRINEMLTATHSYGSFEIKPIALTRQQIEKFNPPPNPAKLTDPRSKWYVQRHGAVSWEVDALPPQALHEILTNAIEENIDLEQYKHMLELEKKDRNKMRDVEWN